MSPIGKTRPKVSKSNLTEESGDESKNIVKTATIPMGADNAPPQKLSLLGQLRQPIPAVAKSSRNPWLVDEMAIVVYLLSHPPKSFRFSVKEDWDIIPECLNPGHRHSRKAFQKKAEEMSKLLKQTPAPLESMKRWMLRKPDQLQTLRTAVEAWELPMVEIEFPKRALKLALKGEMCDPDMLTK